MCSISKTYQHCGPIRHPEMNVTADGQGIQAPGFVYDNKKGMKPEPWSANWIWLNQKEYPEFQESVFSVFCEMKQQHKHAVALFRKVVVLDNGIESIQAWVSADLKYRLYVNGTMVGRGPAETAGDYAFADPPQFWYYDRYDLSNNFYPGVNVITAEVVLQPDDMADYSIGHGGFLFEAKVDYADGRSSRIVSDDSWRGAIGRAFASHFRNPFAGHGHANLYHAGLEPVGWHEADFDDGSWPKADVFAAVPDSRWKLLPSEIPPLLEARVQAKKVIIPFEQQRSRIESADSMLSDDDTFTSISSGSPVTFWLDFGKEYAGHLCFLIEGAKDTKLRIEYQEIAGKTDRYSDYIMRDGLQEFECFHLDAFEHVKVTVSSFWGKPMKIYNICCNFRSYPVCYRGNFNCSDELLNQIWLVGRWTNQLCMQAYHLDSPIHQEPVACTGDYLIESLMNYYTFGDKWLVRQDLLRMGYHLRQTGGIMFCGSYSLIWTEWLADYCRYTGDVSLLQEMMPIVDVLLLQLYESYKSQPGLIDNPPNYIFMDWVIVGNHNLHNPPKAMGQAYLNAFYYRALQNAARFCKILGRASEAEHYLQLAEETKAAFNRHFWNEEKGLYIDGLNDPDLPSKRPWAAPGNVQGTYYSQHTNSLAVLYDLAPREKQAEIMRKVIEDSTLAQAQPYFMHFVLEALHHAGEFGKFGLDQMRRWKSLLAEHPSSLKEAWYGDFDFSHAWGGTPTYQLPAKILGVTPLEPGFEVLTIEPVFGDLYWAEGRIPTPRGTVGVSWQKNGNLVDLELSIPASCQAVLQVPSARIISNQASTGTEILAAACGTCKVQTGRYKLILN